MKTREDHEKKHAEYLAKIEEKKLLAKLAKKRTRYTNKRRCDSKYRDKFTAELKSGIRYAEGLSVMELCRRWRISSDTFYDWIDTIPQFAAAYKLSKADYASWWHENFKGIATGEIKGNAGCAIFAMTNIEGINWSNKVDVHSTSDEEVKKITIELLPTRQMALEHIEGNVIEDAEIIVDNVVPIIGYSADAE